MNEETKGMSPASAAPAPALEQAPTPAKKSRARDGRDYIVDVKTADVEFAKFCNNMNLDPSVDGLTSDEKNDKKGSKKHFVAAIRRGDLIINDVGLAVFTPRCSEVQDPITYYRPTGATLQAMDDVKQSRDVSKIFSAMGDCTKNDKVVFSQMDLRDLDVCMAVFMLFLA